MKSGYLEQKLITMEPMEPFDLTGYIVLKHGPDDARRDKVTKLPQHPVFDGANYFDEFDFAIEAFGMNINEVRVSFLCFVR